MTASALRVAAYGLVLTVVACAGDEPASSTDDPSSRVPDPGSPDPGMRTPSPSGRWVTVLRRLDARRDAAFADGVPAGLGRVYVPGSAVLRADTRLLRAYLRRGIQVESARLRLRHVTPLHRSGRDVRLTVVDRLRDVRVRAAGGDWRALPRDGPTKRVVTLRRTADGWRIAGTRRVAG